MTHLRYLIKLLALEQLHQDITLYQLETVIFLLTKDTLLLKISLMKIRKELYRQFAHPSVRNLKALMKNADSVDSEANKYIEQIGTICNVCEQFKRTPADHLVCVHLVNKFTVKIHQACPCKFKVLI